MRKGTSEAFNLPLRVVCFPSETPFQETKSSFASDFQWVRDEGMCPLFLLVLGPHLVQTHARPMQAVSVSICHVYLEGLVCLAWSPPFPMVHTFFSMGFSEP